MARENNGTDKKTHTRLKDCSNHRNISNIMEEASPSKLGTSKNSKLTNKLEYVEVRGTKWEVRSIKSGRLAPAGVFY